MEMTKIAAAGQALHTPATPTEEGVGEPLWASDEAVERWFPVLLAAAAMVQQRPASLSGEPAMTGGGAPPVPGGVPHGTPLPYGGKALPFPGAPMLAFAPEEDAPGATGAGITRGEHTQLLQGPRLQVVLPVDSMRPDGGRMRDGGGESPGFSLQQPLENAPTLRGAALTPLQLPQLALDQGTLGQALGQRLMLLVRQGGQAASMKLSPEHLGPLDIRLRIEGDTAQLLFSSPHAAVREALEQAIPRLRDTLLENGLDLVQVDIGGRQESDGSAAGREETAADGEHGASPAEPAPEMPAPSIETRIGLVDAFA